MAEETKLRSFEDLTDEEKQKITDEVNDQKTRLGEIFSQCWESEEFKQAFMEDPKAIFEEYGVTYIKDKNYRIIDTPDKTIIHVLPYEGIKKAMTAFSDHLNQKVEELNDTEGKQLLLEGWSWQIYQDTEDTFNVPIPLCPENLTPEELEMVNGGCLIFSLVFLFVAVATATNIAGVVWVAGAAITIAAAVLDVLLAGCVAGLVLAIGLASTTYFAITAVSEIEGSFLFVADAAIAPADGDH